MLIGFSAFSQKYAVGDEMYVIAEGGLDLRKEPNPEGRRVALLSRGSKVRIEQMPETEEVKLPNQYKGRWVEISYAGTKGYVFDAYLSRLSPIEFSNMDETGCWRNDILKDLAEKYGKLDTIEYNRFGDGEDTYRMAVYPLENGGKYIEHYYWEHHENEIQLFELSKEEIDQFVRSILKFCGDKREISDMVGGNNRRYIDISRNNDCCLHNLRIKVIDDKLIIRTQIDPGT